MTPAALLRRVLPARLPWSSELLSLDGRATDLLRDYATASGQPEGARHVDTH